MNIALIGASGGIGSALLNTLSKNSANQLYAFSRSDCASLFQRDNIRTGFIDFADEDSIAKAAEDLPPLDQVIVATGILHDEAMQPEKSLRHLNTENFEKNFLVNTIGPALIAKHFIPKLHKDRPTVFAALSARVGSISDNRLGGWYAYRASKAALNMLIKSISIEVARSRKQAVIVGLHPGTVDSALSKPFQAGVPDGKLFTADFSAEKLIAVLQSLTPEESGKCFAWDGLEIPA